MRFLLAVALSLCGAAHAVLLPLPGTTPQSVLVGNVAAPLRFQLLRDGVPVTGAILYYPMVAALRYAAFPSNCINDGAECGVATDANGVATLPAARVVLAGEHTLAIRTADRSETSEFRIIGVPSAPVAEISVAEGGGQQVVIGQPSRPFVLRLTRTGAPLAGQPVVWSTQGMSVQPGSTTTDSDGVARIQVVPDSGYGEGTIQFSSFDALNGLSAQTTPLSITVTDAAGRTEFPLASLWWGGPGQDGWGMSLGQRGRDVFPVWFTYDANGEPTWVSLGAWDWQHGFASTIETAAGPTRGTPYFDYDPARLVQSAEGYAFLQFEAPDAAKSVVNVPASALALSHLRPFVGPDTSPATRGVSDIWWGGPSQTGWGMSIAELGKDLFLVWFTYGADGKPTWFAMPEGSWSDANTWSGPIYRTHGSPMKIERGIALPYDASKFRSDEAGRFSVTFDGTRRATFQYSLGGHQGTLLLQRFDF